MYLCLIAPFLKEGKVQSAMYHFMTTFNLLGGLMAFIEPSGLVHEYWTLTLHAFLWHMMLIFVGFYLIASGRGAKTMRDYRSSAVLFLVLAAMAFIINLIFWVPSDGDIKMFYVGPAISPLAVFKEIATFYPDVMFAWVDTETYMAHYGMQGAARWILTYDRLFDRAVDNSKILRDTGLTKADFATVEDGIRTELARIEQGE
jgi:hypothetical protein